MIRFRPLVLRKALRQLKTKTVPLLREEDVAVFANEVLEKMIPERKRRKRQPVFANEEDEVEWSAGRGRQRETKPSPRHQRGRRGEMVAEEDDSGVSCLRQRGGTKETLEARSGGERGSVVDCPKACYSLQ